MTKGRAALPLRAVAEECTVALLVSTNTEDKPMKFFLIWASMIVAVSTAWAQTSPPETATGKIGSATLAIKYCAPSVRGRQIFGDGGQVMRDPTAPIWRAGAN